MYDRVTKSSKLTRVTKCLVRNILSKTSMLYGAKGVDPAYASQHAEESHDVL